jgi:hypothetical protein
MNVVLLWPAGLAALAALLVPLLLHLRRAEHAQRVDFAALRWLSPRRRPRQRLRLREWLLLALRLLLVALVALLFAQPARIDAGDAGPRLLVADGIELGRARAAVPALPADAPAERLRGPLASALREADARAPAGALLHVVVPPVVDGLDGARPQFSHALAWHVLADARAPAAVAPAAVAAAPLVLRGHAPDATRRVLRALAAAWQVSYLEIDAEAAPPRGAIVASATPEDAALAQWLRAGGIVLRWPAATSASAPAGEANDADDAAGAFLPVQAERVGRGRRLRFAQPLTVEAMPALRAPAAARRLRELLDDGAAAPLQAPESALRPVRGGPRFAPIPQPLAPWLAWAAALLFALERLVATRAARGSTSP